MHVVDHHSGEEVGGAVRMVHEAARIARGPVVNVADVDVSAFDALFFLADLAQRKTFHLLL